MTASVLPVSYGKDAPETRALFKKTAGAEHARLRKAATELESFFLTLVLKEARKTVDKNELFHGGQGEEAFEGMLDAEYAGKLAQAGGVGLADLLYKDLARNLR